MITRLQTDLQRACSELGLVIHLHHVIELGEGLELICLAHISNLGGKKGMIVVEQPDKILGYEEKLSEAEYGYSVLSEPQPSEAYDLNTYLDMFKDWGWANDSAMKPGWFE